MNGNSTKIFFIRHGITEQTGKVLYGRNSGINLSDEGILQAKKTGEYLANVKIDKVISSPLERAFQTAEQVAVHHGLEVETIDDISDTDTGIWTGMKIKDAIKEKEWQLILTRPSQYTFKDGESFQDVFNRMNKNVMEIVRNNSGKNIVIVAHRDPIIILMAHYLGIHMDNFQRVPCAPASISIVDFHGILAEVRGVGILPSSRIEE